MRAPFGLKDGDQITPMSILSTTASFNNLHLGHVFLKPHLWI